MTNKGSRKTCFVVGPIGASESDDRIHSDWVLEEIITPVFEQNYLDFDVVRADKISKPGSINDQIIENLLSAEIVIADLSTLNANCFYEIGIRHAVQLPIVHIHEKGQHIPFDIASFRSIEFSRMRPADLRAARLQLKSFLDTVFSPGYTIDNPVTTTRGRISFDSTATAPEKLIQDQIEQLTYRLSMLEGRPFSLGDLARLNTDHILPIIPDRAERISFFVQYNTLYSSVDLAKIEDKFKEFFQNYGKKADRDGVSLFVPITDANMSAIPNVISEYNRLGYQVSYRLTEN